VFDLLKEFMNSRIQEVEEAGGCASSLYLKSKKLRFHLP
jgi:hypothetical protein